MGGHFGATRERFEAAEGKVLLLQDTTEFSDERARPELVGIMKSVNTGKNKKGTPRSHSIPPGRRSVLRAETMDFTEACDALIQRQYAVARHRVVEGRAERQPVGLLTNPAAKRRQEAKCRSCHKLGSGPSRIIAADEAEMVLTLVIA